ncbi:MAG TPA: hypothetical protein VIA62_16960 [Thermoanaerobaculia bacterium]|jgi:hypothetical protein|nr:hypothetical protein [Thermoanaerobaculia bacterium]
MKKQRVKKLRLNRETLRSLEERSLRNADGAAVVPVSFTKPCTNVVSDCYPCTGPLDTCPSAQNCPTAPPQCTVA